MLSTVTLAAEAHALRPRARLLGHAGVHVFVAMEDAVEIVPLGGGERITLPGIRRRSLSGECLVGGTLVVPREGGWGVLRPQDGEREARPLAVSADDHPLARTTIDGRATLLFGRPGELVLVDEQSGVVTHTMPRAPGPTTFDEAGIAYAVERREVVARDLATGALLWRAPAFKNVKTDAPCAPVVVDGEIHVRAGTVGPAGHGALVARLARATGAVLAQRAGDDVDPWLPDLPGALEARLVAIDAKLVHAARGLVFAAVGDGAQGVVFRVAAPDSTPRVAFAPELATVEHLVGTVHDARGAWLVAVRLADLPLGSATCSLAARVATAPSVRGEMATVAMALTAVPFFIAEHPVHGRINVPVREDRGRPAKGETVLLEAVTVRAGGVVSVEGYRRAGAAESSEGSFVIAAPTGDIPLRRASAPPLSIAPEMLLRASEAGVALPAELLAVVRAAEADATFREALVSLGFDFTIPARYTEIDAVQDALPNAFPLWTNEYGETLGFLRDGTLHHAWLDAPITPRALGRELAGAIRAAIADRRQDDDEGESDATFGYVEGVLARLDSRHSRAPIDR